MTFRQALMLIWLIWNLLVFFLYAWDKYRAVRGEWRVPEKTLLLMTVSCGGLGAGLAAYLCRHETRKWYFHLAWCLGMILSALTLYLIWWP